jgi:hypothetical protein
MAPTVGVQIRIAMLVLTGILLLLSLIGLGFISHFSFSGESNDDTGEVCVEMTQDSLNVTKISVIILWITLIAGVFALIFNIVSGNINVKGQIAKFKSRRGSSSIETAAPTAI